MTISLVNPSNGEVLFTISASSAVYTTFGNTVTASAATSGGLAARYDGASWAKGDEDLVLTNVTFSIGSFVTFTAGAIDLQHFTAGSVVTDNFNFGGASITFFANSQPMVTLSGSPDFSVQPVRRFQAHLLRQSRVFLPGPDGGRDPTLPKRPDPQPDLAFMPRPGRPAPTPPPTPSGRSP